MAKQCLFWASVFTELRWDYLNKHNGDDAPQNYFLHVPNVMKTESLSLLEPSGPVPKYIRIASPLLTELSNDHFVDRIN